MKIAVVCDWLETYAGAERVLEQILKVYPDADLYALVDFLPPEGRRFVGGRKARTSFIQWLPFARRHFRMYLPLFPLAMGMLNLKTYDLILSSSHCMAKNVRVRKGQTHICYCHSPIRYAWDMQDEYLEQVGLSGGMKGKVIRHVMAGLRWWDKRASDGVTHFIANSSFIAQRIKRCYGREAAVLNPPVDTQGFGMAAKKEDYYLTASRMVPYKKMDMIAAAFAQMPERKLMIIGDGPEMKRVKAAAKQATNISVLGRAPFDVLRDHMQRARAFVFAAKEDFGITPVEALACGTPVIAYGAAGVLDSLRGLDDVQPTGVFFKEQTVESLKVAVETFEKEGHRITSKVCRARAEEFAPEAFRVKLEALVAKLMSKTLPRKAR